MTREEAQKEALAMIDEAISIEVENAIAMAIPRPGKNSWTWKEVRESTINDSPLEGCNDTNFIDYVLAMHKWREEHK